MKTSKAIQARPPPKDSAAIRSLSTKGLHTAISKPASSSYRASASSPINKNRTKSSSKITGISPKVTRKQPLTQTQTNALNSSRAASEKASVGDSS